MRSKLVLFAACLCIIGGASCFSIGFPFEEDFNTAGSAINHALERRKGSSDKEAIIVAKVFVPAAVHDDFISAWKQLEKGTRDESGNLVYDLKKTQTDNSLFLIYGQWKSWDDYIEHIDSSHMKDFQNFIGEEEITVKVVPFRRVSEADIYRKKRSSKSKDLMHVVFGFWVDPKHHSDFIKRWEELADETSKEKGVRTFSIRKSEVDNLLFTVYGTWDSVDDFHKHHWGKHASRFREFKEKHNIVWKLWPLQKIGSQPELQV